MEDTSSLVSATWLANHLDDPEIVVLDTSIFLGKTADGKSGEFRSGIDSFQTKGHIPGARFADLFTQFSDPEAAFPFTRPQTAQFERAAAQLGIDPDSHVVIYDSLANQWAARLWWVFRSFGHRRVSVLDGGLKKYINEGHPLEQGLPHHKARSYSVTASKNIVATRNDLLRVVRGESPAQLVCFLLPDDYAGVTPVRVRPGHIPGSTNLPFTDLIADDNTLKRADELKALFNKVAKLDGSLIVTYCGGGIASTLGALALAVLQYDNTMEYDGSLAEWSDDASLPLEVGY